MEGFSLKKEQTDFLKEIELWLSEHNRTPTMLARKASVSETTIRRILQKEAQASLETKLNILRIISTPDKMKDILQIEHPDSVKAMEKFYEYAKSPIIPENCENFIKTYEGTIIYILATNETKTTREEIKHILGVKGEKMLDNMLNSEMLTEKNSIIECKYRTTCSTDTVKSVCKNMLDSFDFSNVGKIPTALINETESVSPTAAKEINNIIFKAHKQISEILNDPKNRGTMPLFYVMAQNSLKEEKPQ